MYEILLVKINRQLNQKLRTIQKLAVIYIKIINLKRSSSLQAIQIFNKTVKNTVSKLRAELKIII
ncbi:hypothetical protein A7K95_06310 [Pediococcus parvulus]|uniref:Transposase n=1 Tax=Pediococcus parvulus TaxID=54062 RepID=A0ABX2UG13_9LACO|nr:hypothetical protein A7K95_06310 [Pediococcus parvulus]